MNAPTRRPFSELPGILPVSRLRIVVVAIALSAIACGPAAETETSAPPPSEPPSTPVPQTRHTDTTSTTATTIPPYQPVPLDEIDTGAATSLWFPETEAEHAGWADRHNYPPDQPGHVKLAMDECHIDAPNRIVYQGTVDLTSTERAVVGLHLTTFNSPVGQSVPAQVEFTRSGDWTIPVELSAGISDENWAIVPFWPNVSTCRVSVFWSDTETTPERFDSIGSANATHVEFTFVFEGDEDDFARLGTGVTFTDWEHPSRVWAYVNWLGLAVPFEEVFLPDPSAGIHIEVVYAGNDEDCRRIGIRTELGQLHRSSVGCTDTLTNDEPTGTFVAPGFELYGTESDASIINVEYNLIVFGAPLESLTRLVGSLRLYRTTFEEGPEPEPDSVQALDRLIRKAFAQTDEVRRGQVPYGGGYLIFSIGLDHVGEAHEDWVRTYLATFDGESWVLEQRDQESWDTCGFTRTADDGHGAYQVVIAGLQSWIIELRDTHHEGFAFFSETAGAGVASIRDPSGTIRCQLTVTG